MAVCEPIWYACDLPALSIRECFLNKAHWSFTVSGPTSLFWNLYVGVIYATLLLCFVGYPIAFQEHRCWPLGIAGLGYCGIRTGVVLAVPSELIFIRRIIASHPRTPAQVRSPRRPPSVPVPTYTHWIYPILAGVPFGMNNTLIFIYSAHYLAGSYPIYAASAVAGNAMVRYVFAGALPLAGHRLYSRLGIAWTGTLLGLVEVALSDNVCVLLIWVVGSAAKWVVEGIGGSVRTEDI